MNDIVEYKNYYAEIHFSADDEVFFGKLIGINDLVSFEADSVKELKKEFKAAVEDYLSFCKVQKKAPDKTYKGSFNVRIPSALHRDAAIVASIKNMSLNDFVKNAIDITVQRERLHSTNNKRKTVN